MTDIVAIADRLDVCESLYRWFWALDHKNWIEGRACVADRVDTDAPKYLGQVGGRLDADAFIDRVRERYAPVLTLHQCTNEAIAIQADHAEADFLIAAHLHRASDRGGSDCKVMMRCTYVLDRQGRNWLIGGIRETVLWVEGNPGLLDLPHRTPVGLTSAAPTPKPLSSDSPRSQVELPKLVEDRLAIGDVMTRFAQGLDRKDWNLYRACFLDRFTVDFSAVTGRAPIDVDARDWVEFARLRQRTQITHHQNSNLQIRIDGDRARAVLYVVARHHAPGDYGGAENVHVGGYDNEFVRTPSGWRISTLRHPLQWLEGNEMIKDTPDPEAAEIMRKIFGS